ncbi:MAG: radical SAM protein, partial [Christensenellaceae bacterium]|nr:radical SAM protein [Christensenellaceae bacterium]
DSFDKEYAKRMQGARKSSFTFAPEAGTQRLRDVINKNITEEDILRGVRYAFESGSTTIKLYFMIGLPTETYEDLDGIVDLVKKIKSVFGLVPKELRTGSLVVTVSTSSFVPKPFTPFQWEKQDTQDELRKKQEYLRERLKMRGVKYNWHDTRLSYLEAVFARGDRRLGKVLYHARKNGAMFDSWQDYFRQEYWTDAFNKAGVDPDFYTYRDRTTDEVLPWDHMDCYVTKKYLIREKDRAYEAVCTQDCRQGCTGCGFGGGCFSK